MLLETQRYDNDDVWYSERASIAFDFSLHYYNIIKAFLWFPDYQPKLYCFSCTGTAETGCSEACCYAPSRLLQLTNDSAEPGRHSGDEAFYQRRYSQRWQPSGATQRLTRHANWTISFSPPDNCGHRRPNDERPLFRKTLGGGPATAKSNGLVLVAGGCRLFSGVLLYLVYLPVPPHPERAREF